MINCKTKRAVFLGGLALALAASPAAADAVIAVYGAKIPLFADMGGKHELAKIGRDEIELPAALRSKRTPNGMIRVRFEFKDKARPPIAGWVRSRSVRVDTKVQIDVPGCPPVNDKVASVSHGIRSLNEGC